MWSVPDVNHVSGTDQGFLACPARFERATYALEEFVATGMSIYFNSLQNKMPLCNGFCWVNRHSHGFLIRTPHLRHL